MVNGIPSVCVKNEDKMPGFLLLITVIFAILNLPDICGKPTPAQLDKITTSSSDEYFRDQHGRVRLFHGVNAVQKDDPWYPPYLLDDVKLDQLQEWGLNVVRLGSMWQGAQPEQYGIFNETYIGMLRTIVEKLEARGIYTILDMHQDCFNQLYNGFPSWLADTFPPSPNPWPWPLQSVQFWEANYLTQEVSSRFGHFYDNYNGAVDKWAEFWKHIALEFKDDNAVLGYNIMNEPWIGDYTKNPNIILPGVAGKMNLQPNYDIVNEKIREVDKEGIIFYEPVIYGQTGHGPLLGSGLTKVPGGDTYRNAGAYSFHMYCWYMEFLPQGATNEQKRLAVDKCNDQLLPGMMQAAGETIQTTGGATILTEFGICRTWEDRIDVRCSKIMDLADEYFISWVEWGCPSGWLDAQGQPIWGKVDAYLRTYARAIAGIPRVMKYDDDTRQFNLQYEADPEIAEPTEIFVPQWKYQDGFDVIASDFLHWESRENLILVYHNCSETCSAEIIIDAK